jgi:hypothetical protein
MLKIMQKKKKKTIVRQMHPWNNCKNAAKQKVEDDWYATMLYVCKRKHKETKSKNKNKKGTTSATYKAQIDQIFFIKL